MISVYICLPIALTASLSAAYPWTKRDDALEVYRTQATKAVQEVTWAVECYNGYVSEVEKSSPPSLDLLPQISDCDDNYDNALIAIHDSWETISKAGGFSEDQLNNEKLPNTQPRDVGEQNPYTRDFEKQLGSMLELTHSAFDVHAKGQEAAMTAISELSKKYDDREVDISQARITRESSGGSTQLRVDGALIAGVPVQGLVKYQNFITPAVATIDDYQNAEVNLDNLEKQANVLEQTPIMQVKLGQLRDARSFATACDHELVTAVGNLQKAFDTLESVPQDEKAEATAAYRFIAQQLHNSVKRNTSLNIRWRSVLNKALSLF